MSGNMEHMDKTKQTADILKQYNKFVNRELNREEYASLLIKRLDGCILSVAERYMTDKGHVGEYIQECHGIIEGSVSNYDPRMFTPEAYFEALFIGAAKSYNVPVARNKDLYDMGLKNFDDVDLLVEKIFPEDEYKLIMLAAKKITKACIMFLMSNPETMHYQDLRGMLLDLVYDDELECVPFADAMKDDKRFITGEFAGLYQEFKILSHFDQKDAIFTALCVLEKYIYGSKAPFYTGEVATIEH